MQIRPAFGGNHNGHNTVPEQPSPDSHGKAQGHEKGEYLPDRKGEIISAPAENLPCRTRVIETVQDASECKVNLQEADIIVAGGRGLGNAKRF